MSVSRRHSRKLDIDVSLLGFGLMRLPVIENGKAAIDFQAAEKLVDAAYAAGVNYFDTAWPYHEGESEVFAGKSLGKYPRESYFLADKMPFWNVETETDLETMFQRQLDKCGTEYFDFYLFHAMGAELFEKAEKLHAFYFLSRMKSEGKIRFLGFSFHDSPEVLRRIAAAHPWDFAQIQLNYLDWELYRSREQYEVLREFDLPVIVMEPLRGGALAKLTPETVKMLAEAEPSVSPASWGLRYAATFDRVLTVLSGMSTGEQLEDNLATFSDFRPVSEAENGLLTRVVRAYLRSGTVKCTGCRYCACPNGVAIPENFAVWNEYCVSGSEWAARQNYNIMAENVRASGCVKCGACVEKCPQKIAIPDELGRIAAAFKMEKLP